MRKAERPLMIVGAGAFARPDGAAVRGARRQGARSISARSRTAGTASACCTRAASRVGALDLGFVPGEGGLTRAADGGGRHARCRLPARRRRDRHRARAPSSSISAPMATAARSAPTSSCRAPPIRKSPATYVNTEGPRADGDARRLPARRRARGLGDPARAVRRARQAASVRFARAAARRRCTRRIRICMRIDEIAPGDPADLHKLAALGGNAGHARRSARRSPTSISPIRSRAPPRSWPNARALRARARGQTAAE